MMSALFAGVSGLRNHMVRMNLVGDNIANINTIGFKTARVTFREALVQTLRGAGRPVGNQGGTNPVQLGLGMSVASVDNIFAQGGLTTTGVLTDLAIQGAGFFILSDGIGEYYTRAGSFGMDANSNMVNTSNGMYVQGKMANANGDIPATAALGNIELPFGQQDPARATQSIQLANNLNATASNSLATLVSNGSTNIDAVTGAAFNGAGGRHQLTVEGIQPINSIFTGTNVGVAPASLFSSGLTTIDTVTGAAFDGENGQHTLTVAGSQPTNSAFTGTNVVGPTLTLTSRLDGLGVDQAGIDAGFRISVDGAVAVQVPGLTINSTIGDLITAINTVPGVTASLVGGEVCLTRDYAGDGATYNITASSGVGVATNVVRCIFNAAADSVIANSGSAHTFTVTDEFTPTGGAAEPVVMLGVDTNVTTGLVTGIIGLGGGGVTITSSSQLAAGTAVIDTAVSASLTLSSTLGNLGVNQAGIGAGFRISVDGAVPVQVTGLTISSTISDLISAINTVPGVTAALVDGEVCLTRDYAGDGATYNIRASSDPVAGNTNVVRRIFSDAADDSVIANNGLAHTFTVEDVFTPTGETALDPVTLGVDTNPTTGLVTGITGLGDGGMTVISSSQIAAGTAVIDTADTQHATSITVFDSRGGKHTVVFTFTKRLTPNTWKWDVSTSGMEVLRSGWKGQVTFTDDGALGSFTYNDFSNSLIVDPSNGAAMMNIKLFPGTGGEHDGLTGFSAPFTAITKNQDGYGMGMLDKISIDEQGTITGIFTNGISRTLAQVILADFNNQGGLLKCGETLFQVSANSGDAVKGVAGATINASICSGALESSNVDLAQEFTDVIIAQRGFQANARVISTSDQMLNELVNLKS